MPDTLHREKKRLYDIQYRVKNRRRRREQAKTYYQGHLEELREKHRKYMRDNPNKRKKVRLELMRGYNRKSARKLKTEVLTYYGDSKLACAVCGENRLACLSIDHIDGKGYQHRKTIVRAGTPFYRWLKQQGYPNGYMTLCMNCQWIKRETNKECGGYH